MEKVKNTPSLRFPEFNEIWLKKMMSEVAEKITDGTHDTPKPIEKGIPFLTAIHVKDGYIDYDRCYFLDQEAHNSIYKRCNPEKDDLLIVNIGAGTATCAINTVDYEFSLKNVALVKPDKKLILGKFLAQIQRKKASKIFNQLTSGGAQPFLSLKEIGRLIVVFPTLPEQQKIATFLTAVDEKLQALKQKKSLLEQYKKGVMQKVFSQELRFKDENGNEFPDWEEKILSELLDYVQPTKYLVESTEYDDSYKTPVLTAGKSFILGYTNETFGIYDKKLPLIIFDDFTTAIQFVDFPFKAKSSAMKLLVPKKGSNIYFIFEAMQLINYSIGGHERHWISKYSKIEIPVPCAKEQNKISDFLSTINDKISRTQAQIEQTQQYKKGLLQNMFV